MATSRKRQLTNAADTEVAPRIASKAETIPALTIAMRPMLLKGESVVMVGEGEGRLVAIWAGR